MGVHGIWYKNPENNMRSGVIAMLATHDINLIFDIGANVGQFGKELRQAGYRGQIISFEPMSVARTELLSTSKNDPLWMVAPQAAIGDYDGETEIHIAGNSQSSSILRMLNSHKNAAPESNYVGTERGPLHRLDALAPIYLHQDSALFLKWIRKVMKIVC